MEIDVRTRKKRKRIGLCDGIIILSAIIINMIGQFNIELKSNTIFNVFTIIVFGVAVMRTFIFGIKIKIVIRQFRTNHKW